MAVPEIIQTERLRLRPLDRDFLTAALAADNQAARAALGIGLGPDWAEQRRIFAVALRQLDEQPDQLPWLTRAIELVGAPDIVGVTGFHGPPGLEHLRDYAKNGLEFGYAVFERFRRRGIATEASRGLMDWATRHHGVRDFVLTIAPDNTISQTIAARLDFTRVGEWTHEERGLEFIYLRS